MTVSWWASILVATGGSLMVVASLGAMADEIGNVSIWVWAATAAIGGLQCMLVAELAARFPERAGGTPQFAYRAMPGGSPTLGALSAWCYWFAWTPGIAVNLILAATYLSDLIPPHINPVLLAGLIGAMLYIVTALGLKLSTLVNAGLAVVAVGVIVLIVLGPALRPASFDVSQVFPTALRSGTSGDSSAVFSLLLKWAFVATWSSYAAEIASTVCAEIRRPERYMGRVMSTSAIICFVAFAAIPIALFGLVGVDGVAGDPFDAFTAAGSVILGSAGADIVGLGLAVVLILGAETFIIGSSRTIYQMAQDGHLPHVFAKINRRGAPVGSIAWDAVVIGLMLAVFGTKVVNVVAAANFGYLFVFVLMPIAYLVLRRHPAGRPGSLRLSGPFTVIAVLLSLFNAALLIFGGAQWGLQVVLVGVGVSLLIIPVSVVTRRVRRLRGGDGPLPGAEPVADALAGQKS